MKNTKHTPGAKKAPWNKGKGEGYINERGYRCFKIDGKEIREHRMVMEKKLGRKLLPTELVHHLDEDKLNNHPDNLELRDWSEHTIEHHTGSKRKEHTKRTIEVMANYRWEVKRLNDSNADLLKENEQLKIRVEENEAKLLYFQKMYGRSAHEESYLVQSISALKRLVLSQVALEGIIQRFNDYSESVDEQPNRWFVDACEIAEKALAESKKSEYDQEVKTLKTLNAELLEALKEVQQFHPDALPSKVIEIINSAIAKAEANNLNV